MTDQASSHGDFLASLSPRVRTLLFSLAQSVHYLAGETIFREGDPSLFLYVIKSGRVALEVTLASGRRLTLTTVDPGGIFSWSALSQARVETASAHALEETDALAVTGEVLRALCSEDPEVGCEIYRNLTEVISARLAVMRLQALDASAACAVTTSSSSSAR